MSLPQQPQQQRPIDDAFDSAVDGARHRWAAGEHRAHAMRRLSDRHPDVERVIDALLVELERRVGQTFTLCELAVLHGAADGWAHEVARVTAPDRPWAWDLDVVMDAAFYRYERRAVDYRP